MLSLARQRRSSEWQRRGIVQQRQGEAQQGGVLRRHSMAQQREGTALFGVARRLSFDQQGYGIAKHRDGSALIRYARQTKKGAGTWRT